MRADNLTLLTDFYELTMMQGYFKNPTNQTVIFDVFYRENPDQGAYAIAAGLEQVILPRKILNICVDYLFLMRIF